MLILLYIGVVTNVAAIFELHENLQNDFLTFEAAPNVSDYMCMHKYMHTNYNIHTHTHIHAHIGHKYKHIHMLHTYKNNCIYM